MKFSSITNDYGGEFENQRFQSFCENHGISHNFSYIGTPQQNRMVERKNRILQGMVRTILCENNLPTYFWAEAISMSCYISNKCFIRPILKKTPYELWMGRKPNINCFHAFSHQCFILNNGKKILQNFILEVTKASLWGTLSLIKDIKDTTKELLLQKS